MVQQIAFFLPHFSSGGAEGVALRILQHVNRDRFHPVLILQERRGELLQRVPDDVTIIALKKRKAPACIWDLANVCKAQSIDLLISMTNAANLYAICASLLPGHRLHTLVTEHTPPGAFLKTAKYPWMRRLAIQLFYPRATLTGGPLNDIGTDLSTMLGQRAPQFQYLPNPVVDHPATLRPIPESARNIVSVGRLAPEKRFDLLIDAFSHAQAKRPDLRLTIHGEGPERAKLEQMITAKNLSAVIALPGYAQDMDAAHAVSDMFICTSEREGLGNAIIEAMARGIPVLSVDCPFGPRHLLDDGAAGLLLKEEDADSIGDAIIRLSDAPDQRRAFTTRALANINQFEVPTAVAKYEAVFTMALGGRS